jgi:hypothetical protein
MNTDFSPLDTVKLSFRAWWLIVVFMLLGGLAGWAIYRARQPVYESKVAFTFSIDFTQTGELTDVEEDQALESVADILFSSQVMEGVAAAASSQGIPVDLSELKEISSRERTGSAWILRVRQPDPVTAAKLANLWGEAGFSALKEASQHALAAGTMQRYLQTLETCLRSSVATDPVQAYCSLQNLKDIQNNILQTGQAISQERVASRGMMPGLGFQWTEKATPTPKPVQNGQGPSVLAGALTGLIVCAFLLASGLLKRFFGD